MNYNEFMDYVCEGVKKYLGKEYKVSLNKVLKNNGLELTGIVIMKDGSKAAPTVYLDDFYTDYQAGREVNGMIEEIVDIYEKNNFKVDFDFDFFSKYETVKDRILYKLLNYEANRKLLEDVPHIKYMDLAIVYYIMLDNDTIGKGTVLIHNNHVKMWEVSNEQLHEDALRNTPRILPPKFFTMENIVDELYGNEKAKDALANDIESTEGMYILTNSCKLYGACCILYKDILGRIADKLQSSIYIIPSSIHEVIIISREKFKIGREQMEEMVKSVNNSEVEPTDVLGYHVYEYNRANGALQM